MKQKPETPERIKLIKSLLKKNYSKAQIQRHLGLKNVQAVCYYFTKYNIPYNRI